LPPVCGPSPSEVNASSLYASTPAGRRERALRIQAAAQRMNQHRSDAFNNTFAYKEVGNFRGEQFCTQNFVLIILLYSFLRGFLQNFPFFSSQERNSELSFPSLTLGFGGLAPRVSSKSVLSPSAARPQAHMDENIAEPIRIAIIMI